MASAAKATASTLTTPGSETIVGFSAEELRAPFMLRCAAMSIDYLLLVFLPAAWLMFGASPGGLGRPVWIAAISVFVANFLLLPLATGRSLGKLLTGLTIVKIDGTRIGAVRLLIRNSLGYLITIGSLGLGFVVAAFSRSGRSLHDILTGTVVIRGTRTPL